MPNDPAFAGGEFPPPARPPAALSAGPLTVLPASRSGVQVSSYAGSSLAASPGRDPVADVLIQAKSPKTRRAYSDNLKAFFRAEFGQEPEPALVRAFLAQDAADIAGRLAAHRNGLNAQGRAASTIALRLAAVRALIDLAHRNHLCATASRGLVKTPKAVAYRDTRGPSLTIVKRLLALPDRGTLKGQRDFALLLLLCSNGLRRFEVCGLAAGHLDVAGCRLSILGKFRDDREWVTLKPRTLAAIREYLAAAGHAEGALFRNTAHRLSVRGQALLEDGLDNVVRTYGKQIELPNLSCHKLRHYAITALLDSGAAMRAVQRFSRHKDVKVLYIYDDNREDLQGDMSQVLEDLLDLG